MSTLTPLVTDLKQPNSPEESQEGKSTVPNWAYGVIAGGSAAVVTAGVMTYHVLSKKQRQKAAEAEAKNFNQDQVKTTPRLESTKLPEVVSRYSPRPNEKIV